MAENKGEQYGQLPSAPPNAEQHFQQDPNHYHRPPPPSYEESQRWNPQPMHTPQLSSFYPAMNGNPPPYTGVQQPMQYAQQQRMMGFAPAHQQYAFNYNTQPQMMPGAGVLPQQGINTIQFDAGARFKGQGGGSISIPPPPPGCAPTPEQLAALQGQPVILKKKKNSFF